MTQKLIDLTGKRFYRLLVMDRAPNPGGPAYWYCKCDCGKKIRAAGGNLRKGATKSCGCWYSETRTTASKTHGLTKTPEHVSWVSMRTRCNNPRTDHFKYWGGRGITICKRWDKFENFLEDMGLRPTPKHTLDRRNNEGNYCKSNCRWATVTEQNNNQRRRMTN